MTVGAQPPYLLTPGPLTTSDTTKGAMSRDWGSRDPEFIAMTARVCRRLEVIAGVTGDSGSHVCVPVQGSGTFAVEATLDTLIPRDGKIVILVNGAYGERMAEICRYIGRDHKVMTFDENTPVDPEAVAATLAADDNISHVAVVHCETTSGILNPLSDIAEVIAGAGRRLLIDAMSSFGALPLDVGEIKCDAVIASANKCLEGVPGLGFAIMERAALAASERNATSLSLDLFAQWRYLEKTGQWRFTPPTHVIAALDQALEEFDAEGGAAGRGARYADNCRTLIDGMRALGFEPFLSDNLQAPIIVTFHSPADPNYDFETFYDRLKAGGYAIYPGKLTKADSFRIGCIGRVGPEQMEGVLAVVTEALAAMGITNCSPRRS